MIILPLYLKNFQVSKNKTKNISLNMNWYRNVHFILNNKVKVAFKEMIESQIKWLKFKWQIWIKYDMYYSHMSDLDNWQSVVTKFFQDALVESKCIPDDNMTVIVYNWYRVKGKDKDNPRFEVTILQDGEIPN